MAVFMICNTSPFTHSTPPHELQTSLPHHAVRFQENIPRFQEKVPRFQENIPRFRENLRRLRERVRHLQKTFHISECSSSWISPTVGTFLHSKEKSPFLTTFSLQYLRNQYTFSRVRGAISASKCLSLQDKVYNNVLREFINGNISHHSR